MLAERQGLALELARQPAEITEDVGRDIGLAARLGAQGIAGLERDGARQLLGAGLDGIGDLEQRLAAFARHDLAPFGIGLGAGGDGALDIGGIGARHFGDRRALGRILDGDARARRALDPLAADQHALGRQRGGLRLGLGSGRHAGPPRGYKNGPEFGPHASTLQDHATRPGREPINGLYSDRRKDVRSRAKSGLRSRPLPCRISAISGLMRSRRVQPRSPVRDVGYKVLIIRPKSGRESIALPTLAVL